MRYPQLQHERPIFIAGPRELPMQRVAVLSPAAGRIWTRVQAGKLFTRFILLHVKATDCCSRCQQYGLIRFESRLDVSEPPHAEPKVAPSDKVSATPIHATLIAA